MKNTPILFLRLYMMGGHSYINFHQGQIFTTMFDKIRKIHFFENRIVQYDSGKDSSGLLLNGFKLEMH